MVRIAVPVVHTRRAIPRGSAPPTIRLVAIDPDRKDWTWVTVSRCPECGFDGGAISVGESTHQFRQLADAWTDVLSGPGVRHRSDDGTWSPLEYACHLRDAFGVIDRRLELMLAEDDPTFEDWDQDATAVDLDYGAQDPAAVAEQLADAVGRFADRLASVNGDQWHRAGTRSDGARFTIETLGRYALHEPIHHLVDIGQHPHPT